MIFAEFAVRYGGRTLHISIMTHPYRPLLFVKERFDFWVREFMRSDFFGGVFYVSEATVDINGVPTIVVNTSHCNDDRVIRSLLNCTEQSDEVGSAHCAQENINQVALSRRQLQKRIAAFEHFLRYCEPDFSLSITDDTFVFPRNLGYLFDELKSQGFNGHSLFVRGNCMPGSSGAFLQGGSGYFMSRYTAARLCKYASEFFPKSVEVEDCAFRRLFAGIGLASMFGASSEYIMGQYILPRQVVPMQTMNFTAIMNCSKYPPRSPGCRRFFVKFNRVAVLHRLSVIGLTEMPPPVYDYPDNMYWSQGREIGRVCLRRG
jgi:hypothetical protein